MWMETGYVVSAEESAEPGLYSFDRYAYLREIFDSFVDPDIEMVVVPKAAQTGWTTGFTGFVGSVIANDPCRILIAMPTQDEAEIWSKDRLKPNLAVTPALRAKVRPAKSRDVEGSLHKDPDFLARWVARLWNRAWQEVPGWPSTELTVVSGRRRSFLPRQRLRVLCPPRRDVEQPFRGPRAEHAQPAPAAELHGVREHADAATGARAPVPLR